MGGEGDGAGLQVQVGHGEGGLDAALALLGRLLVHHRLDHGRHQPAGAARVEQPFQARRRRLLPMTRVSIPAAFRRGSGQQCGAYLIGPALLEDPVPELVELVAQAGHVRVGAGHWTLLGVAGRRRQLAHDLQHQQRPVIVDALTFDIDAKIRRSNKERTHRSRYCSFDSS